MQEMLQTPVLKKLDRYLRRKDTVLAKAARVVSPESGESYRESTARRLMELAIATPGSLLALPIIVCLAVQINRADGGSAFFKQNRTDTNGSFKIWKLRAMVEGAEQLSNSIPDIPLLPEHDPRNTELGSKLRAYEIEELPQLIQVVLGRIRLVGLRASTEKAVNLVAEQRPTTFESWEMIFNQEESSLFSLNSAITPVIQRKQPGSRYHPDHLYVRKRSLGFDIYVIARNLMNLLDKYLASQKA